MAINEACQVWIEQRIREELEDGGEKSLSEIARAIAAEIEKSFETSIKPDTIRKRAERMARTNVQNEENQGAPTVKPGHTGHKISPTEIVEEVARIEMIITRTASLPMLSPSGGPVTDARRTAKSGSIFLAVRGLSNRSDGVGMGLAGDRWGIKLEEIKKDSS